MQPKKFNQFYHGFLGGFIISALSLILFLSSHWDKFHNFQNLKFYLNQGRMFTSLLALSAFPTLLLFFYLTRTDRYRAAYGLIGLMMVYGLIILILRSGELL